MFFDILNKNIDKVSYHIEFQTKNDSTMVVRMFEKRGIGKGIEKGRQQGLEAVIEKMILKGVSIEEISNILDIDINKVKGISKHINR